MPTDTERREAARRLRKLRSGWSSGECYYTIINALGLPDTSREDGGAALYARLADLIEPTDGFDLDTVQRVCFECMEGCDEPEWTLYTTIHDAIARYKRGESGLTCDRDALLALANELERVPDPLCFECPLLEGYDDTQPVTHWLRRFAQRIREALGVAK